MLLLSFPETNNILIFHLKHCAHKIAFRTLKVIGLTNWFREVVFLNKCSKEFCFVETFFLGFVSTIWHCFCESGMKELRSLSTSVFEGRVLANNIYSLLSVNLSKRRNYIQCLINKLLRSWHWENIGLVFCCYCNFELEKRELKHHLPKTNLALSSVYE